MFWRDLQLAWRSALRNPGYSFLIVAVLAIGIGANAAIFSLANVAFFRALPYPHAERLAFLWQNNHRTGESEGAVSYPNYADWRAQSRSFEDMAFIMFAKEILGRNGVRELLNGPNGPARVPSALVSTNFFSVLGVQPLLGRSFSSDDSLRGKTNVVIISYALWKSRFAHSPGGIGIRIVPLREQLSEKVSQGLLVLWAAIFGVLLIACVNAANLMMARAAGCQKEIAVRFSLGATRTRVVTQFLAESLLLAAAGAVAGLLLAA